MVPLVCLTHLREQTIFQSAERIILHTNTVHADKSHFFLSNSYSLFGICSVLSVVLVIYLNSA